MLTLLPLGGSHIHDRPRVNGMTLERGRYGKQIMFLGRNGLLVGGVFFDLWMTSIKVIVILAHMIAWLNQPAVKHGSKQPPPSLKLPMTVITRLYFHSQDCPTGKAKKIPTKKPGSYVNIISSPPSFSMSLLSRPSSITQRRATTCSAHAHAIGRFNIRVSYMARMKNGCQNSSR